MSGAVTLSNRDLILELINRLVSQYGPNGIPRISVTKLRENIVLKGALAFAGPLVKILMI